MPARPATDVLTNTDGSVTIQYKPAQSGVHEVNVTYNEQPVEGTPLHVIVDAIDSGFVTAYGLGLYSGISGKECAFHVVGGSRIDVSITGSGKADIVTKERTSSTLNVVYVPVAPGEYNISITEKGKHIHGSPFCAKISGEGRKRSQLSVAGTSEYTLGGFNVDLTNMIGVVKAPGACGPEPCLLKKTPDGKLAIAGFQPKKKGSYVVDVTQDGASISGSPFKIEIGDTQLCHANHVKVSGASHDATANVWNEVKINVADAGLGSLGISVEGAHRSDLELKSTSTTEYVLQYKPHEPGIYLMNIKFGDDHVTGSPFMVSVGGQPSGRIRETVVKQIQAPEIVTQGQKCHLQLKVQGTDPLDMEATLTSPSGKTEACEIRDSPDGYDIRFTPVEDGVHTISLKYKGINITGSPFQYTVGKPPVGGNHKVEFGGSGVDKGEVGAKNEFNIYTREAGAGLLSVAIEGPSKAKIDVRENPNGYTLVSYVVTKEGDYGIHVKYNDEHVPHSPAMVHVSPESGDAKLVTLSGLRDRGLDVDRPATFNANLNGAIGTMKAHVKTPSGTEDDVFSQELEQDLYALRFLPKENGVYYVHIKFNDAHIPGSPFPMLVGKMGADPALVFAKGDGLEQGEVGKPCKFTVVTTNAGAGTLAVHVNGPSKVAVVCAEVDDGYDITYTPMAPGDYMIMIKYCSVAIAGCPFKAIITGKGKASDILETSGLYVETVEKKPGMTKAKRYVGDACKVIASGNGIKKGFVGRPSTFTLDCKDAGQSLLTMGMISPTGNPVTEFSCKKQKPGLYNVAYRADEKGDHTLTIRWGTNDVPGSPFIIQVG